jgi:hypothetical protein
VEQHAARGDEIAVEVDRTDNRLESVSQHTRRERPPLNSSPRPSMRNCPRLICSASSAQTVREDEAGANLGQDALGRLGIYDRRDTR